MLPMALKAKASETGSVSHYNVLIIGEQNAGVTDGHLLDEPSHSPADKGTGRFEDACEVVVKSSARYLTAFWVLLTWLIKKEKK